MTDAALMSKISGLSEEAKEEVSKYLDQILIKYPKQHKKPLKFGMMKGMIKMSDDFDEPLDEFKDYM